MLNLKVPGALYAWALSILLAVSALAGPRAWAAPDDALAALLNRLPAIRIVVSNGPGTGHESTAATVYTRLRQLGYDGRIEVVHKGEYPSDREKLIPLFPHPETDSKLAFITRAEAARNPTILGIVGATDEKHIPLQSVGVGVLLTLQPLQWTKKDSYHKIEFTRTSRRGSKVLGFYQRLAALGYVFELPETSDPSRFIADNMNYDSKLALKTAGLQAILSLAAEVQPVYGHSISELWQLRKIYEATREALGLRPGLFKGGVVMPIFNELSSFKLDLLKKDADAGKILFAQVTDSNLATRIAGLGAQEVLVVHVGRVSKPVFEYLFSQASVVPVIEGKNSANLMQLTGKPYLPSSEDESFVFDLQNRDGLSSAEQNAYYGVAGEAIEALSKNQAADAIADFIIDAKNSGSALNRLFAHFGVDPSDLSKDKLYQGLLLARELVGQRICDAELK